MTISAILTEWGALYRAGLATVNDLMVKLMEKSETDAIFPRRVTDSTIMEKASAEFSSVLQAFQKAFTPMGGVTFLPRKIELQRLKIDISEYPDDLVQSWLGFLADNGLDRKQWPFTKWWMVNLLAKAKEDKEKYEIFKGVPVDVTPGEANSPGENMLGIRKQIRDSVTASKWNSVVMGAVPDDPVDFVDYMETLHYSVPELLRNEIDGWHMRRELRDRFKKGMREKYDTNYDQTGGKLLTIMDTDVQVRGLLSHAGSDLIWTTPQWNRQAGVKAPENPNIFQLESIDRQIKAFTDWFEGVGFWIEEYGYSNDQDLS